jgi:hypothetical protein
MSEQLSWSRLKALLRNESIGEYRSWLIASAVIAAVLLFGATVAVINGGANDLYYRISFFGALFAWGTIHSSLVFSELHDKSKNTAYLLLPASALEKTLAPLLTTTIVLIAYLLVFTAAASVVIEGINRLAFGRTNEIFNPFERDIWALLPVYVVVQSGFFLGAAWFRNVHYLKTLLAIVVGCLVFVGLLVLAFWVAGIIAFTPTGINVQADLREWLFLPNPSLAEAVLAFLKILGFVVLPIFCWFVAWLRVGETQVSHGV